MSIAWLSSKCFTQKRIYIHIYTVQDISNHSTVKLSRKGVLQTKRTAFFKSMHFQIFLQRGERRRAATFVEKEFQILAAGKWKDLLPADLRYIFWRCHVAASIHPPEMEINYLKTACGCQCGGLLKTGHTRNPLTLRNTSVNVKLHIPQHSAGECYNSCNKKYTTAFIPAPLPRKYLESTRCSPRCPEVRTPAALCCWSWYAP